MAALALTLQRRRSGSNSTIGWLTAKDAESGVDASCFTCEDPVREPATGRPAAPAALEAWVASWKIAASTAIPSGRYQIVVTISARFGRRMALLANVPGFTGIRIHPGNTAENTEGCLLVGQTTDGTTVGSSALAAAKLEDLIETVLLRGDAVAIAIGNAA